MQEMLVKMKFKGLAHFGQKNDLTRTAAWVGSDSLFSALINAWALLFGSDAAGRLLAAFAETPPFVVSSAFLYIEMENPCYFLPRPNDLDVTAIVSDAKQARKINWLPWETLAALAANDALAGSWQVQNGYLLNAPNKPPFYCEVELPRVSLDSYTAASNLYHVSAIKFHERAGLYFLARCQEQYIEQFQAAVRLLGDEGIGGERSYGMGIFTPEFTAPPPWPASGPRQLLLSGYYPSSDELPKLNLDCYTLRTAGGWAYSLSDTGQRRHMVRLFAEGSVIKAAVQGCLVDVTPSGFHHHRLYRSGLAYTLPWKE